MDAIDRLVQQALREGDAEAWLSRQPNTVETCCALAVAAHRAGRPGDARQHLLDASELDPSRPEPYALLGDWMVARRQPERAERYYQQACRAAPTESEWRQRLLDYYHEADRPYSAKRCAEQLLAAEPDQPPVAGVLTELEALYPEPGVTVMIRAHNVAGTLGEVVAAVQAQSYPVARILVVDDGCTDATAEIAAELPVTLITLPVTQGWSACRRAAAEAAETDLLAFLAGDVIPAVDWLERLVLFLLGAPLAGVEPGPTRPFLVAVNGDVLDRHALSLPDLWRARHLMPGLGPGYADWINALYTAAGIIWREAALLVTPPGQCLAEDFPFWDELDRRRYRLAYTARARAWRERRDSLATVLAAACGFRSAYLPPRAGTAADDSWIGAAVAAFGVDRGVDQLCALPELAYLTFLSLPWRLLTELRRQATGASGEARSRLQQTHAATWLSLMSLLVQAGGGDLVERVVTDLARCLPDQAELAELCGPHGVAAQLACDRGEPGPDPLLALPDTDVALVNEVLEGVAQVWLNLDRHDWNIILASAERYQAELDHPLPPDAPRVALLRPTRDDTEPAPRWELDLAAYRAAGLLVTVCDGRAPLARNEELLARLTGFGPDLVVVVGEPEPVLDLCLQIREALAGGCLVALDPDGELLGDAQVDAIVPDLSPETLLTCLLAARELDQALGDDD